MKALVLVDIQNDFMPDGALPVPNGYEVIPVGTLKTMGASPRIMTTASQERSSIWMASIKSSGLFIVSRARQARSLSSHSTQTVSLGFSGRE